MPNLYLEGYRDGAYDARQLVAKWHQEQAKTFKETENILRRDGARGEDIMRAAWAAASHAANAVYILRMESPKNG